MLGLYMITRLHERGELQGSLEDYYVTFLASMFRSVRFGAASAHGEANMVRFNYFAEQGAFARDAASADAIASTCRGCARRWTDCPVSSCGCRAMATTPP